MSGPPTDPTRSGETISHYRLLERIGGGGMGVVYKAEDLRLGRTVALKFVSDELAPDESARQRFEREARVASSLNHPNICTIYEIDQDQGRLFIAMEFLEGHSLESHLRTGARPINEVLELGIAVADALIAAHARGVCHRDIKPANIFMTTAGTPKLLDFGLAKVDERSERVDQQTTAMLSTPGLIVGTAHYMSPEQAVGAPLDGRTDVYSLGLVLYEMATGQQAFTGTTAAVLHAILTRSTPPPGSVVRTIPPRFDEIIAKSLEKDRDVRYQSAADLRTDLKRLKRDLDSAISKAEVNAASSTRRFPTRGIAGAAAIAAVAIGAIVLAPRVWRASPSPSPLDGARFSQVTDRAGSEHFPSLSPDGRTVIYAASAEGGSDIYLQRVEGQRPINLTADTPEDDTQPVFSPDGDRIAFRSERGGGGLFVMGATGESVRRVSEAGYNPTWSPDGKSLVYATESVQTPTSRMGISSLWIVDITTGEKRRLSDVDSVQPSWSPHGHRIAYWTVRDRTRRDLETIAAEGGKPVVVTDDAPTDWSPAWSPDGRYLFFASDRGGSMNLWRVRLDERTGRTLSDPEPVTTPSINSGQLTFSRDGTRLAYVSQSFARNIGRVAFDAVHGVAGEGITPVVQGTRFLRFPDVAPGGESIVYTSDEKLFIAAADGSSPRQLTEGAGFRDRAPRWSSDGQRIAFYSDRTGIYEVWTINRDGSGLKQMTNQRKSSLFYPVWSPDSKRLAYGSYDTRSAHIIDTAMPWDQQRPVRLPAMASKGAVFAPWSWSQRGGLVGWVLRLDGGSGGIAIYDPVAGSFRHVSSSGSRPVWLPDHRHVVAIDKNRLSIVDTRNGRARPIKTPRTLEEDFAMSPDGRSIYFIDDRKDGDVWLATLPARRSVQ